MRCPLGDGGSRCLPSLVIRAWRGTLTACRRPSESVSVKMSRPRRPPLGKSGVSSDPSAMPIGPPAWSSPERPSSRPSRRRWDSRTTSTRNKARRPRPSRSRLALLSCFARAARGWGLAGRVTAPAALTPQVPLAGVFAAVVAAERFSHLAPAGFMAAVHVPSLGRQRVLSLPEAFPAVAGGNRASVNSRDGSAPEG